jgi:hypothetical protein
MPESLAEVWPALPYDAWKDTYATVHMWSQVVGKVALAQSPRINHSWAIAMHVTPSGISTRTLWYENRAFTIAFDFVAHQLVIETSDGDRRALPLEPRSVAAFYNDVMATLEAMGLPVKIWPVPVEVPSPIPFDADTVHSTYDPEYVNRFWRILVQVDRVFTECQRQFVGKRSPVHFFWGSFDLAVTRFSGKPAPPMEGPEFMRDAYSHEVISHGFWPGSGPLLEAAFYAYAVPAPDGFNTAKVRPDVAYYHQELKEFILPYGAVQTSAAPDQMIRQFLDSTYERAATLAGWDRKALERVG